MLHYILKSIFARSNSFCMIASPVAVDGQVLFQKGAKISFKFFSQIYTRDPRPPIPPCVMASSAMGLNFGDLGFLPTTLPREYTKQMCSWSSCAMGQFNLCLSSHSDRSTCRLHAHLTNHDYFDYGEKTPMHFEPHAGIEMAQVLGSLVYVLWVLFFFCKQEFVFLNILQYLPNKQQQEAALPIFLSSISSTDCNKCH